MFCIPFLHEDDARNLLDFSENPFVSKHRSILTMQSDLEHKGLNEISCTSHETLNLTAHGARRGHVISNC
jgi:hypothetical protein